MPVLRFAFIHGIMGMNRKMVVHPLLCSYEDFSPIRPESIHDTDNITYRCFLPDLTRFVSIYYVASGRKDRKNSRQTLQRDFSPA
jgi:hypothetical protein